ncbi:InlB B-repeat-containing protein [Candidatus Saccharibacteria bacterium]|nr:InlB B-repeat-containing protein [Candidatus Saccharibacteria bacterium]
MIISRERGVKLAANRLKLLFVAGFLLLGGIGVASAIVAYQASWAEQIANGIRVNENSDLDYYLHIKYDGIDRNGVHSNDSTRVEVRSGVMAVTDKIPDGLVFQGFVETSNGIIAAHPVNGSGSCAGLVIDDTGDTTGWNTVETEYVWHGLHYDKASETVSLRVKNVMAGCEVTVGIRTKTPRLREGEKRRDFYNFATEMENLATVDSNMTHHWIGKDETSAKHTVRYSYTGVTPLNAKVPAEQQYISGSTVSVAMDPVIRGYTFSGWTTADATIENGKFTMPDSDVTLVGSFVETAKYNVKYQIETEAPEGYLPPAERSYAPGEFVELDTTQAGWTFRGYRFTGWTFDRMVIENGGFAMPEANVTIRGGFEKISYEVNYEFIGDVMPDNWSSLVPASGAKYPGDTVQLAAEPSADGYQFLGWMHEDNFSMPENDVTIQGKWMSVGEGVFQPEITQEITNPKDKFYADDEVRFKVTVKNTANFTLKDVNVYVDQKGTTFDEPGEGASLRSAHLAQIDSLAPGESRVLNASYDVHEDYETTIENPIELLSATADNHVMNSSSSARAMYRTVTAFDTGIKSEEDPSPDPTPTPTPTPTPDPEPDTPEEPETPETPDSEEKPATPSTLDEIIKYVSIFAGCGLGLGVVIAIIKAQRK